MNKFEDEKQKHKRFYDSSNNGLSNKVETFINSVGKRKQLNRLMKMEDQNYRLGEGFDPNFNNGAKEQRYKMWWAEGGNKERPYLANLKKSYNRQLSSRDAQKNFQTIGYQQLLLYAPK